MTSVILTVNITSQLCGVTKHLSIQWKRLARRLENPGGRGRKAPLPLLLLPLEARETEGGGTEIAVGAHQDVVAWGRTPTTWKRGAITNEWRRGQRQFQFRYKVSIAMQNCHFTCCFFLTQIPEHLYILQKLQHLETISIIVYN